MNRPESPEPLILCLGSAIVAVNPADGLVRWSVPTKRPVVRIHRVGSRLFGVHGMTVLCLDLTSGAVIGEVDVGFEPEAGIVCGEDLVLARAGISSRHDAVVCLSPEGRVRWRGTLEVESTGLLEGNSLFTVVGAAGERRGEVRYPLLGGAAGLAYETTVVQPDLGRRT